MKKTLILIIIPVVAITGLILINKNNNITQSPTLNLPQEELKITKVAEGKSLIKTKGGDLVEIGIERASSLAAVKFDKKERALSLIKPVYAEETPSQPYLKLNKWDSEVSLKVSIPYQISGEGETDEAEEKLVYKANNKQIEFLAKKPEEITTKDSKGTEHKFIVNEEGGVEFNTILETKPESNILEFPLEAKNLDFFYQPPLNEENQDKNLTCTETTCTDKDNNVVNFRPENVVGSYAVYYKDNKSGDFTQMGGKNYKAGKAFHIYRPKIWDANGKEVYGSLSVILNNSEGSPVNAGSKESGTSPEILRSAQNDKLVVTIPQSFLDSATYPITVDPNFGYETPGQTQWLSVYANDFAGSLFTGAVGTVSKISLYCAHVSPPMYGSNYWKGLIVQQDDLTIVAGGVGSEVNMPWGTSTDWYFSTLTPTIEAVDYVLGFVNKDGNATTVSYYDSGDANQGYYENDNNYASPTNPTSVTYSTNKLSIYATYTSSATPTPTPTPTLAPQTMIQGLNIDGGVCVGEAACPTAITCDTTPYSPTGSWTKAADTLVRDITSLDNDATVAKDIYCDDNNCVLWTDGAAAPSGSLCLPTNASVYGSILWSKANDSTSVTWSDTADFAISGGDIGGTHTANTLIGANGTNLGNKNWLARDYTSAAGTFDAMDTCKAKGNYWRLPNVLELDSIRDQSLGAGPYTSLPSMESEYYWSSSQNSSGFSYTIYFSTGNITSSTKTSSRYVRCVRN